MTGELGSLRSENAQLRRALETRDVIGQAKGVLKVTMSCTADQAFAMLVHKPQQTNTKLADVAAEIVDGAERAAFST